LLQQQEDDVISFPASDAGVGSGSDSPDPDYSVTGGNGSDSPSYKNYRESQLETLLANFERTYDDRLNDAVNNNKNMPRITMRGLLPVTIWSSFPGMAILRKSTTGKGNKTRQNS
jgi:hypothetical protein